MNMTLRIDPSLRRAVLAPTSLFAMGDEVSDLVLEFPHAAPDPGGLSLSLRRDGPSGDVVAIATAFSAVESHRRLLSAAMSLKTTVLDAWRLEVKAAADEAAAESSSTTSPKKAPSPMQTAWLDISSPSEVYASCPVPILLRETSDLTELLVGAVRYDKAQSLTDLEKETARSNIGAGEPYDPSALESRVADLEAKSETDPSFGAWKSGASVAAGSDSAAESDGAAYGLRARATGGSTLALGRDSRAYLYEAVAIGRNASSGARSAVALGVSASASDDDAVSVGHDAKSNGAKTLNVSAPDMSHVYLDAASAAPKTLASAVDAAVDAKTADLATKDYASQTADDYAEGALVRANAHSDANLATAKTYADGKLTEANSHSDANLATAKTYADGKLTEAKSYADGKASSSLADAKKFAQDEDAEVERQLRSEIPTKVSELANDSNFITSAQVAPGGIDGYAQNSEYAMEATNAVHAREADSAPWTGVTGTPTTLAGYGITDAASLEFVGAFATYTDLADKADLVDGKVPASQLPSFVDDVLEYDSKSAFPQAGETGKIYVAKDTNLAYRWGGTAYVEISPSLALGETASTAYPGDKGKAAAETAADAVARVGSLSNVVNDTGSSLAAHTGDKSNPHAVTAAQTGALPLTGGTVTGNIEAASFKVSNNESYGVTLSGYTRGSVVVGLGIGGGGTVVVQGDDAVGGSIYVQGYGASIKKNGEEVVTGDDVDSKLSGYLSLSAGGTVNAPVTLSNAEGNLSASLTLFGGASGRTTLSVGSSADGAGRILIGRPSGEDVDVLEALDSLGSSKQDRLTGSSAPTVGMLALMGSRSSNGVSLGATSDGTYGALAVKGADNRTSVLTPDGTPVLTQTLGDARYATAEALASLIPESIRKTVDGAKWALTPDLVSTKTTTAAGEASCTLTSSMGSATLSKSPFDDRCFIGTMTGLSGYVAVWWDGSNWNWGISPYEITSIEDPTILSTDPSSDSSAASLTFEDGSTATVVFGSGSEVTETSHLATVETVAAAYVPLTRTINGKPLSGDVTLTVADLGANVETDPVFTAWKDAEAVAAGDGAAASDNGVAIGHSASASNLGIALGITTSSGGGVAIGNSASAQSGGVAIGLAATSSNGGVAIGDNVTASGVYRVVVGGSPTVFGFSTTESGSTVVKSLQSFLDQYWKKTDWLVTVPLMIVASDGYIQCPDFYGTDGSSVCFSADGNDDPSTTSRLYPDGSKVVTAKMLEASAQMTVVDGQPVTVEHGKFYSFKPLSTADAAFTLTTGFDDGLEDEAKIFFDCATAAPNITLGATDVTVLYKEGSLKLTDMAISGTSTPNRYMVELKWFKTSASGAAQKFMVVNAYKVAEATA